MIANYQWLSLTTELRHAQIELNAGSCLICMHRSCAFARRSPTVLGWLERWWRNLTHKQRQEATRDALGMPSEFDWFGNLELLKPTENEKLKILHALQAKSGQYMSRWLTKGKENVWYVALSENTPNSNRWSWFSQLKQYWNGYLWLLPNAISTGQLQPRTAEQLGHWRWPSRQATETLSQKCALQLGRS